jgi:4-amino-4-deoxy-L-arabinose transferase-like glycosyltransferase
MKHKHWLLLGMILYLLVTIAGLFVPIVINAAKYAQVGREILDNQDWINMTIGGEPYDQKPPLLFWIAALVFQVTGVSVISFKAVLLLISAAGIYGTFKLASLFYCQKTGVLAAFFWATCLGYSHYHNDIHTDTLLVVPVILSIWQYAAWVKSRKDYHFYLGTLFVGLAMLTKGPVGVFIIAAAVGVHLLFTRDFKAIFNYRWLLAIPIVLLIIVPALWGLYDQFGLEGIKFYFWTNNAGRISGSYAGTNTDPFFYVHTTMYMIAPWAVFSFVGVFMQIREKVQKKWSLTSDDEFYTLGGSLLYLIVNSIARAKNPHYELPVLPLISIMAARWALLIFDQAPFAKLRKVISSINLASGIVLFLLSGVFLIFVFPNPNGWIWLVLTLMLGGFIYVLTWKNSLNKQLTYLVLAISALLFTMKTHILPNLTSYQSGFEACRIFNDQAEDDEQLHMYTMDSRYWEVLLYSKNYGRYIVTPEEFKQINPPANDWIFTGPKGVQQLVDMHVPLDTVQVLHHNSMTSLSLKFLNPKTRSSKLKTRYLLQIRQD